MGIHPLRSVCRSGVCQSEETSEKPQPVPWMSHTGAADTAMRHFDIDIGFLPFLGFIWLPFHVSLSSAGVKTSPALELVVGALASHFGDGVYKI